MVKDSILQETGVRIDQEAIKESDLLGISWDQCQEGARKEAI